MGQAKRERQRRLRSDGPSIQPGGFEAQMVRHGGDGYRVEVGRNAFEHDYVSGPAGRVAASAPATGVAGTITRSSKQASIALP